MAHGHASFGPPARLVPPMADDDHTRHWHRHERAATVSDALQALRMSIIEIREAPGDLGGAPPAARDRRRAVAGRAARAAPRRRGARASRTGRTSPRCSTRSSRTSTRPSTSRSRRSRRWRRWSRSRPTSSRITIGSRGCTGRPARGPKAADAFEQVGAVRGDARGGGAARRGQALSRSSAGSIAPPSCTGGSSRAGRAISASWRALDDVLCELGRWREVAEVRGERAARAESGVEKAALLRAQARALEQAGDLRAAASAVAQVRRATRPTTSAAWSITPMCSRAAARAARRPRSCARGSPRRAPATPRPRTSPRCGSGSRRCSRTAATIARARPRCSASCSPTRRTHLPALERITALAAGDPDPRVHADALLRYAAAIPDARRSRVVRGRGRAAGCARPAISRRGGTRYEQAAALATDDAQLQRELADARTAASSTPPVRGGDRAGAEARLRAILDAQRHHVGANLALVELLGRDRSRRAPRRDRLHEIVATSPARVARLVHRFAELTAALGDVDESHLLLARGAPPRSGSLAITLALGESCFARRLWRQAALHLAAARGAPRRVPARRRGRGRPGPRGAGRGARAPARQRGQALRAGDAPRSAVRVGVARARRDRERARRSRCAPPSASSTRRRPRPIRAIALRLFDALGDMALDVLADPARAERCWRQVADAARADARQAARAPAPARRDRRARRDVRAARAAGDRPASRSCSRRWRRYVAGAAIDRALALADEVIAMFPRDAEVIARATTIALGAGDAKRAGAWTRRLIRSRGHPRRARADRARSARR